VSTLREWAQDYFDVTLTDEMLQQLASYSQYLSDWNQKINLTTITEPQAVVVKHFLDSLSVFGISELPQQATVLDMGTGGGLPGMALKIACPEWDVTMMDATAKKIRFLNDAIQHVGLTGIAAIQMRAEDAGQDFSHRERYDIVVARALARMPVLMEYLLPLCKVGGHVVAMKGGTAPIETIDAKKAIKVLGGKLNRIDKISLPTIDQQHYLVIVDKVKATPSEYPRRAGTPTRNPIGGK